MFNANIKQGCGLCFFSWTLNIWISDKYERVLMTNLQNTITKVNFYQVIPVRPLRLYKESVHLLSADSLCFQTNREL